MSEHAHAHETHTHAHSPLPYLLTLIALLILTVVTVGAAYVNFGSSTVNIIIAMFIATIKATLVALFFMHLRHDKPLNAIIFVSSLIFLGIFLGFSLIDVGSRAEVHPSGRRVQQTAPAKPAAPAAGAEGAAPAAPAAAPAAQH
jgi:cytochrome c oxidase subunit IV